MSQRIKSMGAMDDGTSPVAESMLHRASAARGLGAMSRELAPVGPQEMLDPLTNPRNSGVQAQRNQQLAVQNIQQNTFRGGVAGAQSGQINELRKARTEADTAEYRANQFVTERKAMMMDAGGFGKATLAMQNAAADPTFRRNIAVGKLQSLGLDPALAELEVAQRMYD